MHTINRGLIWRLSEDLQSFDHLGGFQNFENGFYIRHSPLEIKYTFTVAGHAQMKSEQSYWSDACQYGRTNQSCGVS